MKNLKQALGKKDQLDLKSHKASQNMKNVKDNHANSKWRLVINSDDSRGSSDDSRPVANLIHILSQAHQKGQTNYQQLLANILNCHKVIKSEMSQKQNLKALQRLLQSNPTKFPAEIKHVILKINQTIKEKIKTIESKDVKINQQLQSMQKRLFKKTIDEKAQQIHSKNYKKIGQNIKPQIKLSKMRIKENKQASLNKNQGSGSQDSGQVKLSKLLNSATISNDSKKSDSGQNCQEQGYSFSAIMNASSAVKPRESKIQKQQILTYESQTLEEDQDDEHTNLKDEAFIFFRPKKVKK